MTSQNRALRNIQCVVDTLLHEMYFSGYDFILRHVQPFLAPDQANRVATYLDQGDVYATWNALDAEQRQSLIRVAMATEERYEQIEGVLDLNLVPAYRRSPRDPGEPK